VNESEALRWVTRQWENWTEKDVISDVYEMLRDFYKNGRLVGDYSRRWEQQYGIRECQMTSYIV